MPPKEEKPESLDKLLKTFQSAYTKFKPPPSSDPLVLASALNKHLKKVEDIFNILDIEEQATCYKLFRLTEPEITRRAEKGVEEDRVKDKKDPWDKLSAQIKIAYQIDKLQLRSRQDLEQVKQKPGESILDLKLRILDLWDDSAYTGDKEARIKAILVNAITDKDIIRQYNYSLMAGKKELTVDGIIDVSNVLDLNKPASSSSNNFSVNQVVAAVREFDRRFYSRGHVVHPTPHSVKPKCWGCGSRSHRIKDPSCPAKGKNCRGCQKLNHFVGQCRVSNRGQGQNRGQNQGQNQGRNQGQGQNRGQKKKRRFQKFYRNKKISAETSEQPGDQELASILSDLCLSSTA